MAHARSAATAAAIADAEAAAAQLAFRVAAQNEAQRLYNLEERRRAAAANDRAGPAGVGLAAARARLTQLGSGLATAKAEREAATEYHTDCARAAERAAQDGVRMAKG